MLPIVWTSPPQTGKLRAAFQKAASARFVDRAANRRLLTEFSNVALDGLHAALSGLHEMSVNIRGNLPAQKRRFYETMDRHYARGQSLSEIDVAGEILGLQGVKPVLEAPPEILAAFEQALRADGPVLIVANHSYAPFDGLALMSEVHQYRGNYKIMANAALQEFDELAPRVIPVDISDRFMRSADPEKVNARRISSVKAALKGLESDGGCVILFPAASISKAQRWGGTIQDQEWLDGAGLFVRSFARKGRELTIIPVFIDGHMGGPDNSRSYHMGYLDVPTWLNAAIMKASILNPGPITLRPGMPMKAEQFAGMKANQITSALRQSVYELAPPEGLPQAEPPGWRRALGRVLAV